MAAVLYDASTAASVTALAQKLMDRNLCREILLIEKEITFAMSFKFAPEPKYKFSREWHVAEYDWVHYGEVMAWCAEQFGPHPRQHDAWSRWWDRYEGKVHFRDEKDYNWFILRWGA